ncbi:hypothetical protein RJ639_004043 [Escallonia herrerae]|uniref:Uncharacterized protein n=1 Tax=Escallonia herrerae TaxID=1293975 RepID=A0AA88W4M3_9ASTE|nr:hypothetical protein RJ639_004043 [Escallonia herrerae]
MALLANTVRQKYRRWEAC